jgi:mismatch-specific thymine-DNA glycosylase
VSKIDKQLQDDGKGYGKSQSIAMFGNPDEGKFEMVMTGRQLTVRVDGHSIDNMAFGGPVFHGHAATGFNEKADHPGNVFWPLLYDSGLLPTPLTYAEDARILEFGIGLTDLVKRPTPSSADLSPGEARAGVPQLHTKLVTYAPRVVCFNGKGVYAWYTNRAVDVGPQNDTIGAARVFVVPSTSARNGRWQRRDKAAYFQTLRQFVDRCA